MSPPPDPLTFEDSSQWDTMTIATNSTQCVVLAIGISIYTILCTRKITADCLAHSHGIKFRGDYNTGSVYVVVFWIFRLVFVCRHRYYSIISD